jgi:hypothetical protein
VMQPDGTYLLRKRLSDEALFDAQAEFLADSQQRRKARHAVHEHGGISLDTRSSGK